MIGYHQCFMVSVHLLDLAKEYLQNGKLAEVTDAQFGEGCSEYAGAGDPGVLWGMIWNN